MIRSKLVIVTMLVLFFATYLFFGWLSWGDNFFIHQSKKETFGINYNDRRSKLRIPLLPKEWYTKETSVVPKINYFRLRFYTLPNYWYSQYWSDFNSLMQTQPYHKEKEIKRFVRNIDTEIDRFVNIVNDSTEYLLEINFNYLYEEDSAWSASIIKTIDTKDDYSIDSRDITLAQADSILFL